MNMATTAVPASRPSPRSLPLEAPALLPYLLVALTVAGLGELVLLRTLSRVGVHIPKEGAALTVYDLLTRFGSLLFNLATVLAVVAVVVVLPVLLRVPSLTRWAAVAGLTLLVGWSLTLPLLGSDDLARLAFGLVFSAVVLVLAVPYVANGEAPIARRAAVGLVAGAFLCGQYYALSYAGYRLLGADGLPPLATQVLALGESLVLLAASAIYRGWGRQKDAPHYGRPWLPPAVASVLSLVLLASYAGNGSTSAILSLWTEGLTLYLPFPLYLAAFWLFSYTVTACLQRRSGLTVGCALLLLFVAGFAMELTYQHLLAALALALLVSPRLEPEASSTQALPVAL